MCHKIDTGKMSCNGNLSVCEDDFLRRGCHITNVYVGYPPSNVGATGQSCGGGSGTGVSSCEDNCRKRQRCETEETQCERPIIPETGQSFGGSGTLQSRPRTTEKCTPRPEPKNIEPDFGVPPIPPPDPLPNEDVLFDDIGFPDDLLTDPTFEEIKDLSTPNPFIDELPPETIVANDEMEEEAESTMPSIPFIPEPPPTPPPPPPNEGGRGLTPETTTVTNIPSGQPAPAGSVMMQQQTAVSQAVSSVTSQDPDGIGWISPALWAGAEWDGIPMDPVGKTNQQLCDFIAPDNQYVIRGLRQRFYEVNPFADNTNPTPAEIDNWNIEVILHFRALFGNPAPLTGNPRLFLEARWADERKRTTRWDTKYPGPGDPGKHNGVCFVNGQQIDTAGGHCGESFFPDETDRALAIASPPYNNDFVSYPELQNYTQRHARSSGISSVKTDIPWSIKLARVIRGWVCGEGTTGHAGPFLNPTAARTQVGISWWYIEPGNLTSFRGKWR